MYLSSLRTLCITLFYDMEHNCTDGEHTDDHFSYNNYKALSASVATELAGNVGRFQLWRIVNAALGYTISYLQSKCKAINYLCQWYSYVRVWGTPHPEHFQGGERLEDS